MRKLDLTNNQFGRLTIIKEVDRISKYRRRWLCLCDCGKTIEVCQSNITNKHTQSCGCLHIERIKKSNSKYHNIKSGTPTYRTWSSMIHRATKSYKSYKTYRDKNISVCKRWLSFENFIEDMGERPRNTTLDRIDNNNGYFKNNCRWATKEQQQNNTSWNKHISFDGKNLTVSQWGRELGVSVDLIRGRIRRGWDVKRTLTTPKLR